MREDNIIVDPDDLIFVPGRIYVVRVGNEVAAKRLTDLSRFNGDVELLSRVVAYGSWNKC